MKKIVSEIFSYVNHNIVETHAAHLIPGRSRKALFKKPEHWDSLFNHKESPGQQLPEAPSRNIQHAVLNTQTYLINQQSPEGFWCGLLGADTTLESDYIIFRHFMGLVDPVKQKKLVATIVEEQLPEGGWNIFPGGPSEISATVKAYFALVLAGLPKKHSVLAKAREWILSRGGIDQANSFTKFYLALFGQYPWDLVPAIPPEIMLFPRWFYFNIYEMSSWTRGIVIPLSIIWSQRPQHSLPEEFQIRELFVEESRRHKSVGPPPAPGEGFFSWRKYFLWWDRGLKWLEGRGPHFIRKKALELAEKWMLKHFEYSEGLGAIYPAIMNSIIALKVLGYSYDHPVFRHELAELERLEVDHGHWLELQPCFSPVWDTALTMIALTESGLKRDHPALVKATQWLLSKEIRIAGDWKVKNPTAPIGGWAFEFENQYYPDIDDTIMVILALRRILLENGLSKEREKAILRALNWVLSMQCDNGGWAAFDVNNHKLAFNKIPFADHNAMLDPATADITGRILEVLGNVGYDTSYDCVRRAIAFLKNQQEADGSWYGRWGVNYIYGTWQVLKGLALAGEDLKEPYIQRAVEWLKSVQGPDGGWGETCVTYEDPSQKGQGPSTPSQTAWALMGLMTVSGISGESVERGIRYLLSTQIADGSWEETEFTGTGFPKVFYLEYTMYRNYFPLWALGMYRNIKSQRTVHNAQFTVMERSL